MSSDNLIAMYGGLHQLEMIVKFARKVLTRPSERENHRARMAVTRSVAMATGQRDQGFDPVLA